MYLTKILLYVKFKDLNIFVFIEPLIYIQIEIAAVAYRLALNDFDISVWSFLLCGQLHDIISPLLSEFRIFTPLIFITVYVLFPMSLR